MLDAFDTDLTSPGVQTAPSQRSFFVVSSAHDGSEYRYCLSASVTLVRPSQLGVLVTSIAE
jgi:hypothetical protein